MGRYEAPNVESFIFRFYGRILRHDMKIDGSEHENLLDFGCGEGAALRYFMGLGFNCYGVDIAPNDLDAAKAHMPEIASHLRLVDPKPQRNLEFFAGIKFDVVVSIQTLDFLSDSNFQVAIENLYNNMAPGACIYASMNGWQMYYREHSQYVGDGLWHFKLENDRVNYDLFNNFVKDREDMKNRFHLFRPVYIDYYDSSFREEGSEFRYTFFGIKD